MPVPPLSTALGSTTTGSSSLAKRPDQHKHRRRFIGPMPEKVLFQQTVELNSPKKRSRIWGARARSEDAEDEDDGLQDVIREHALDYFMGHGGSMDEWNEDEDRRVQDEMLRRWKDSEWSTRRRTVAWDSTTAKKWIGSSFNVGVFLGVNLLDETASRSFRNSTAAGSMSVLHRNRGSATADTFVTALSHTAGSTIQSTRGSRSTSQQLDRNGVSNVSLTPEQNHYSPSAVSADSTTALLAPQTSQGGVVSTTQPRTEDPSRPNVPEPPLPNSIIRGMTDESTIRRMKAKALRVHYEDTGHETPVHPSEVLARTGSALPNTSAAAAQRATAENQTAWGEVIMRDRMLVRVSYTERGVLPADFDEKRNRTTGHLQDENWTEYIVAWRKDSLELYREHSIKAHEWFSGCKRLAYVIPLGHASTRLSLYSFVDLTFCLICAPTPLPGQSKGRQLIQGSKKGLDIFIFKVKSRTRAVDWFWKIWHHKGGQLPPYVEIRCPILDTRIKVNVPDGGGADVSRAYAIFDRPNIIGLCERRLRSVQDYQEVVERALDKGSTLELAWNFGTCLDWVWLLEDVQEKPRQWAILYGVALKQGGKHCHLELRMNAHAPRRLRLKDGTRMDEPVSVEGYVERIKPSSQMRQAVYLSTHDGYLFTLRPAQASQPLPPGPLVEGRVHAEFTDILRKAEVRRGTAQVMSALGVVDLRNVVAVRRAFQLVPQDGLQGAEDSDDAPGFWELERSEEDDQDEGGDEGLAKVSDKSHLRMRRSFELLLTSGGVLRYETFSCGVALEWIVRLRSLVSYWKKRHQADAHLEMNIVQSSGGYPRVTPLQRVNEDAPAAQPDTKASLPELSDMYNWCVLDDCRPILRCGRLFARKGLRGQYRHMLLVLISGHLVLYRITAKSNLFHRRDKTINLLDAYVLSGYLAARYLPGTQYNPDAPPVARRYQDGLETEDSEEDTLFMVWYHTVRAGDDGTRGGGGGGQGKPAFDIPVLDAKRKTGVFRTRSKLERDAWVWAINSEMEKTLRVAREREDAIREAGELATPKD